MTEERTTVAEKINFNSDEATAALGVSKPTLLKWTHMDGGIPHFYVGRKLLYPRQGLIDWSNKQAEKRSIL